jgi:hypothetical protein
MPIRLPVVLSQHSAKRGKHAECEETWITSLLFEERLDATLVGDLNSIELDSTDHLCLEGLKGDFVLVTWAHRDAVLEQLTRLRLHNIVIVPLDGSSKVASHPDESRPKKIYLADYQIGVEAKVAIAALKNLLESLETPVFSLKPAAAAAKANNSKVSEALEKVPVTVPIAPMSSEPPLQRPLVKESLAASPSNRESSGREDFPNEDFPNIDQLIDEFDKLDT